MQGVQETNYLTRVEFVKKGFADKKKVIYTFFFSIIKISNVTSAQIMNILVSLYINVCYKYYILSCDTT